MSTTVIIIVTVLLIFLALAFIGDRLSKSAGKQTNMLFKATEKKYDEFVQQYIANEVIEKSDFQQITNELQEKAFKVLKPEIDGLFSHINATELSDVKVKHISPFFQNAISLSESLFEKRHKTKKELGQEDRNRLHKAFQEAIEADLVNRINRLKSGYL